MTMNICIRNTKIMKMMNAIDVQMHISCAFQVCAAAKGTPESNVGRNLQRIPTRAVMDTSMSLWLRIAYHRPEKIVVGCWERTERGAGWGLWDILA